MTPETAQSLEPGTTPGPWKWQDNDGEGFGDRYYDFLGNDTDHALETQDCEDYSSWVIASDEDKALIAAAPDMRATIAAQTWEYGVEVRADEDIEWLRIGPWWPTVEKARAYRGHAILRLGTPYSHDRVIRRLVGPVEVVEVYPCRAGETGLL